MALSELQRLIIAGLRLYGLDGGDIALIILKLKTEEQQWTMAEYLHDVIENTPNKNEILETASRITSPHRC